MAHKLSKKIIGLLPYSDPFLFVDEIYDIDENSIEGSYCFSSRHSFYKGHFKDNPVTPGVILTECMSQIGLVCLGIYISGITEIQDRNTKIALTSSEVEYFLPVFPDETVKVFSKKIYFRFGKLKCDVRMINTEEKLVAKGIIAGMIDNKKLKSQYE